MSPATVGFIGIFILIILILVRMHIGISMSIVGFLGFAYIAGWEPAMGILRTAPYTTFASDGMSVIPLFILMGSFAFAAGMSEDLYRTVHMITIYILTKRNPELGPPGPRTTAKEKLVSFLKIWEVIVLFIVVIGGIYLGIFTPTEAAGVGAFCTFLFAGFRRKMTWENFKSSLSSTTLTTGMLFLIVLGAMILGYFFSVTRLPFELASTVAALPVNRYVILVLILLVVLLLGCLMDSLAIVLLTIPVFYPLIMKLGFDPIWFGIIVVRVTEMGLITPPVGLNVFIIQGITQTPMETIFRGVTPFLIADLCQIVLLILLPEIILFLPNLMS